MYTLKIQYINIMNEVKELDDDMKELLKNINLCCLKINEQKNLNCTFNKLDFLEKEAFYDAFPNTKFNNN